MSSNKEVVNVTAGENLSAQTNQMLFVYLDSGDSYKAKKVSGLSQQPYGVLEDNPMGSGQPARVAISGRVNIKAGGTIQPGGLISSNASAKAVAATSSTRVVGQYVGNAACADGQVIDCILFAPKIERGGTSGQLVGSATADPGNITSGSVVDTDITVTGATTTMVPQVNAPSLENSLLMSYFIPAADTLRIRLYNPTGGAINPASQTFYYILTPVA